MALWLAIALAGSDRLVDRAGERIDRAPLRAERVFRRVLAREPGHRGARYGLGVVQSMDCWDHRQRCVECLDTLSEVLADGPFRHALYDRSTCLYQLGDLMSALADLDVAIAADPADLSYRAMRATVLIELGRPEAACEDLIAVGQAPAECGR